MEVAVASSNNSMNHSTSSRHSSSRVAVERRTEVDVKDADSAGNNSALVTAALVLIAASKPRERWLKCPSVHSHPGKKTVWPLLQDMLTGD